MDTENGLCSSIFHNEALFSEGRHVLTVGFRQYGCGGSGRGEGRGR